MVIESFSGPANIVEYVEYSSGAVVSKTLIGKPAGSVTLFAFDEGQGLSEHTAPFDALVQILDGEADVSISNKPFHLKTGDCLLLPAHQPHALKAHKRFKMMLTMIRS